MKKTVAWGLAIVAMALPLALWADGAPTPLTYSGVLLTSSGAPVTAPTAIGVSLWDSETSTLSISRRCQSTSQVRTPDAQGRFTVALDDTSCATAVQQTPNLWVEVQVAGVSLAPRTKLTATPYALEASRATVALTAARHVVVDGGQSTSVGGLHCGATAATTGHIRTADGGVEGYRAGKLLCQAACNSPSAHMCRPSELIASVELGVNASSGWIAGGFIFSGTGPLMNDCSGFRSADSMMSGANWSGFVNVAGCNSLSPILCCD